MSKQERSHFKEFEEKFHATSEPEEKVSLAVGFMKETLSQSGSPGLKDFWDAKSLCIEGFKAKMNAAKRKALWDEYVELTRSAKRLKQVLDEQSAFNVEQIELAIDALAGEIDSGHVAQSGTFRVPQSIASFVKDRAIYETTYDELFLLGTHATRLNALRKEIIDTDMRIKQKNRLLKRIADLGDLVFPKKRTRIQEVSDAFILDVEAFAVGRMQERVDPYTLRDEIKAFQEMAKGLSLSGHAFKVTRATLNACWQKMLAWLQERREENQASFQKFDENFKALEPKVVAYAEAPTDLQTGNALLKELKATELSKKGFRILSDTITAAQAALKQQQKALKQQAEAEGEQALLELIDALEYTQGMSENDFIDKQREAEALLKRINASEEQEKRVEERLCSLHADVLLAQNDPDAIAQLKDILRKRLEGYRKEAGLSSLDFEKAMQLRERVDATKAILDRLGRAPISNQ